MQRLQVSYFCCFLIFLTFFDFYFYIYASVLFYFLLPMSYPIRVVRNISRIYKLPFILSPLIISCFVSISICLYCSATQPHSSPCSNVEGASTCDCDSYSEIVVTTRWPAVKFTADVLAEFSDDSHVDLTLYIKTGEQTAVS